MSISRPLIIGGDGQIGRALAQSLSLAGTHPLSTTRRPHLVGPLRPFVDLQTDLENWEPPGPISVAYLCAGATAVEECRRDPDGTANVNVQASRKLAQRLRSLGARIVCLSTNLVFDGSQPFASPLETPNPQTEYGRQKLQLERAIAADDADCTILRLTKVIGPSHSLLETWRRSLREGSAITAFADVVIAPLSLTLVVNALALLAHREISGIVHMSGVKDVSYLEIARRLGKQWGAPPHLVQPVMAGDRNLRAEVVPRYTSLDTTRMKCEMGIDPPQWEAVIDEAANAESVGH